LGDDTVISMSILRHEQIDPELRDAYLRRAAEERRQNGDEAETNGAEEAVSETVEVDPLENIRQSARASMDAPVLTEELFADLAAREEFVLSVTEKGFGVRSSAYGYRITGRGGQGINNMDLTRRGDSVIAVFPVGDNDQIMLVTDGGMVIRCPVHDIRIVRRGSAGVVIFRVGEGERVVSVARLPDVAEENGDGAADADNEEGDVR
jgi:DNA gyrase subunit A